MIKHSKKISIFPIFVHIKCIRLYSTEYKPAVVYRNTSLKKYTILKENKYKSGIYRWVNVINGDSYIGSSVNITKRLTKYYSLNFLNYKVLNSSSRIFKALLKYNHSNFDLEILEYCKKELVIKREQYYLDILKPKYNILKVAGSLLGFKHSYKTLLKFKNRKNNNCSGYKTTFLNIENNETINYKSLRDAAKSFGVSHVTITRYIKKNIVFKDKWKIKLINKI